MGGRSLGIALSGGDEWMYREEQGSIQRKRISSKTLDWLIKSPCSAFRGRHSFPGVWSTNGIGAVTTTRSLDRGVSLGAAAPRGPLTGSLTSSCDRLLDRLL